MNISSLLSDPKYNSAIIRSTGLLSGKDREERIINLLEHNVWLAAKCKNTCILEEDSITDLILLKCAALYKERQDPLSLVALMELGEAGVFCHLLNLGIRLAYKIYNESNQSVAHIFSILGENVQHDQFWEIYNLIVSLGYQMDIDTYNLALSKLYGDLKYQTILNAMESSGIKADATTYYHLITKSTTYNEAAEYYLQLKEIASSDSLDMLCGALRVMIRLTQTKKEAEKLYNEYESYINGSKRKKNVESSYCCRMIAFAEDYDACIKALQRFCDYVDISNGKKKDIEEIINTYCHQINTLLFNEEGFWTSFEMICHISQKRHINIDYYNKKSQTIKGDKSNLDISLINVILYKFSYFGQVVKMFTIMHKHHIRIHSDVICIAFEKALTIEDLTYLLETYSPLNIDSKIIVSHIRHFSSDMAELIYQYLVDISHPFNIYIYNTLLKICDIKFSIKLLDIMKESCISPDIQSIQPLICRCNDKYQFIRIISIASSLNIQPDTIMYRRVIKTIKDNIEFAHLINDIKTDDIQHHHISTLWMDLLVTSQKYG